ncbi:uncharacterized protein LOC129254369 [Lytechinus pictus]|uniref:uncharacterized protein LOC129254369 n=1 Tax=Lytechinus pictus TaxID=7653 RepID=UPI0030B9B9C3
MGDLLVQKTMASQWTSQDEHQYIQARQVLASLEERRKRHQARRANERAELLDARRGISSVRSSPSLTTEEYPVIPETPDDEEEYPVIPETPSEMMVSESPTRDEEERMESEIDPSDSEMILPDSSRDLFDSQKSSALDSNTLESENSKAPESDNVASEEVNMEHFYDVVEEQERDAPRFGGRVTDFNIVVRPLHRLVEEMGSLEVIGRLFSSIISRLTEGFLNGDLVGFILSGSNLRQDVGIPLTRYDQLSVDRILALLEQILQSNEDFNISEGFKIRLVHIRMPQGGKGSENMIPLDKFIRKKGRFIQITNKDELCLGRALVVAMAHAHKEEDPANFHQITHPKKYTTQFDAAKQLFIDSNVPEGVCGIPEIEKFQNILTERGYQIAVYVNGGAHGRIYAGPPNRHFLSLFYHNNHFDVITKMPAFLRKSYFCNTCLKGYDMKAKHKCKDTCSACKSETNCVLIKRTMCERCGRVFKSQECFDNHLKQVSGNKSVCRLFFKCKQCNVMLDSTRGSDKTHDCRFGYCERCRTTVSKEGHQCFMIPLPKKKKNKAKNQEERKKGDDTQKFIFYDFECRQDDKVDENDHGSVFKHVPNLCVAIRVCGQCFDKQDACPDCGVREHVFRGKDTLDKFGEWLFGIEEDHRGVIAIAHNARSYDSQFIQEYCLKSGVVPQVIMSGAKILSLTLNDVKCIDSLSFLAMPLSSFPSTFQLKELKKGFFPHFFNTLENQDHDGPTLPPKKYYDPDGMSTEKRDEFDVWYAHHQNDNFNLQRELLEYCRSDVQILMEGCMAFRRLFMSVTDNIDPFHNITIASACNTVFRTQFLKRNSIGLIPVQGYRHKDRHSIIALKWLEWVSHNEGIQIEHARNGGEHRIGNYKVDGYDSATRTCYEFLGDIWHGCPRCYKRRDLLVPGSSTTVQEVYDQTMYRINALKKQGYRVITMWECDFAKLRRENKTLQTFLEKLQFRDPLNPRHAFYGGRTNAVKLSHRIQGNERIKYVDVCSLYPWVCKYGKYPLGHPDIITKDFEDIQRYFGLVKCKVYPPRQLFHPVLPYRNEENKLLFPLCRTCANEKQTSKCTHSDEERALESTWVTEEVKKAIELGYKVVELFEVWHYPHFDQYNPRTQEGGLFRDYIDLFLKVKQESSGWPSECHSHDDEVSADIQKKRANYVRQYHEREGVLLDPLKIKANKGLRAVSKICLNSFWGKFGQRNNLPKTVYTVEPEEFFSLVSDPKLIIKYVDFPTSYMAHVQYVEEDDFLEVLPNTNVVVAAFTTCWARLKLYSYLEELQKNVLYFDTDSIIYLKNDEVEDVPTGNFLGDMTDELEKDFGVGSYITELQALGPKNYSYQVFSTKHGKEMPGACKVRGITLNYRNAKLVNFDTLNELVHGERTHTTVTNAHRIARMRTHNIVSRVENKIHRMVYDKRVRLSDFNTVPYGY